MYTWQQSTAPHERRIAAAGSAEVMHDFADGRLEQVVAALLPPGSSIVLTGEHGCGKSYLAQAAAHVFENRAAQPIGQLICNDQHELLGEYVGAGVYSAQEACDGALLALEQRTGRREMLIVALGIDRYEPHAAAVLEQIVRTRRARFIGTAQQVVAAADRLVRNPCVQQLAVEPLTLEECDAFVSRLLDVDHFARRSLDRWYEASRGNQHALVTLALAAERRGAVQRARRVAWVADRDDHPPVDFIAQLGELTPAEQSTLELVAFAAPLHEPALLRLLDADSVHSLSARQILVVRTGVEGVTALGTRLPIVAEAVRTHLSPLRRAQLASACYEALSGDDATLTPTSRLRLVRFGIEGGCAPPVNWVWQAMRASARSGDLRFVLRLALAAMSHDDAQSAAEAIVRACDLAHFLGDLESLDEALSSLQALLVDEDRIRTVDFETKAVLAVTSICFNPLYANRPEAALAALDRWEHRWKAEGDHRGRTGRRVAQPSRVRMLSLNGRLRQAFEAAERIGDGQNLDAEHLSTPARTFEALIRVQRGEFRTALELAEAARRVTLLHGVPPTASGDLEGFAVFLAHWARGTTQPARRTLEMLTEPNRDDLTAVQSQAGFVDLGVALFALQEARWHDAAELTGRLVDSLAVNDPFGALPLAEAAAALALAALGDETAYDMLRRSEAQPMAGAALALHGFVRLLSLRARHWLRDPDLADRARALADWAMEERLPLIELEALDVLAHETAEPQAELIARMTRTAEAVDQPIADAILAHTRALTHDGDGGPEPEERLLSELGVWLPLPPVGHLSGREREVALFTALGYPSKHIADRLHLSARTVETHLAHVYSKLGLAGREELRLWFSQRRETVT